MDAIDVAISRNYHLTDIPDFQSRTWADFEKARENKDVYLFGIGIGVEYYFRKYGDHEIKGVLDNDISKQGIPVHLFISKQTRNFNTDMEVADVSVLKNATLDYVLILITSLKYCQDIYIQVKKMGITCCFSLLCMEEKQRRLLGGGTYLSFGSLKELFLHNVMQGGVKPKPNRICIETYYTYEGHGKAITKQILAHRNDMEIIWIAEYPADDFPHAANVHFVARNSFYRCVYSYATSKIWLSDGQSSFWDIKRDGQWLIEMKHWASITLKSFYIAECMHNAEWRSQIQRRCKYIDYILVGSKFDEDTCRFGFLFEKEVVYVGSPRSDILFSGRKGEIVREKYDISLDKNLLLYAPTFQTRNKIADESQLNFERNLDFAMLKSSLEQRFGGEWLILLRLHPAIAKSSKGFTNASYILDVSDYSDSQDLVVAADVLITDYSSIMFEPALIKKPVFLFSTNKGKYLREDRPFLIDYDTLPFPIATTNEALADNIKTFNPAQYERDLDAFMDKYGVHEDGHASERAVNFILDLIAGKVKKGHPESVDDYIVIQGNTLQ